MPRKPLTNTFGFASLCFVCDSDNAAGLIEAWVESFEDRALIARAELRNPGGKLCVAAKATYMVMTMQEATSAIGTGAAGASTYTEPAR